LARCINLQTVNENNMNPGKWIVVVFILFAAFIGTLVTVCMREDISLVAKDYYNQELAYQDQISRINNAAALPNKPQITVTRDFIRVEFDSLSFVERGKIDLFCPSDSRMDRNFEITIRDDQAFTYALSGLKSGMYRVKLSWSMDNKDYYQEEIVNL
jgi:hypothetical protein